MVIGDSVTSIGEKAFSNCRSLTSIIIPDSVTSIGFSAFEGCRSLTSITLPAESIYSILGHIFGTRSYTGSTATSQLVDGEYATYYIPTSLNKVTVTGGNIGSSAFYNCGSLTEIVISDSVTSIGYSAFYGCSSLTSVYYKGTASDWAKITIDITNGRLTSATRYYYVENESDLPTDNGNYWHYDENGNIAIW